VKEILESKSTGKPSGGFNLPGVNNALIPCALCANWSSMIVHGRIQEVAPQCTICSCRTSQVSCMTSFRLERHLTKRMPHDQYFFLTIHHTPCRHHPKAETYVTTSRHFPNRIISPLVQTPVNALDDRSAPSSTAP
jgi:hypothetical protein